MNRLVIGDSQQHVPKGPHISDIGAVNFDLFQIFGLNQLYVGKESFAVRLCKGKIFVYGGEGSGLIGVGTCSSALLLLPNKIW